MAVPTMFLDDHDLFRAGLRALLAGSLAGTDGISLAAVYDAVTA